MRFKKVIKFFEDGNVCVFGLRGRGKDLLMSNVVVRRKLPYISNINYGYDELYYPFDYSKLDCGENTYRNFLSGVLNPYTFDYPDHTDVYISDAGVYFPSQYCNELNKIYPYIPVYQALSRQLGCSNFHVNSQSLGRVWDKIREQSDTYILCRKCVYFSGGLVFQWITIYDRYQSALDRQKPMRVRMPLFADKELRLHVRMIQDQYTATHGVIKNGFLVYRNKSSFDTRRFRTILQPKVIECGYNYSTSATGYNRK